MDLKKYLNKEIEVIIDRPLGSRHPKFNNTIYPVNYGFIPDTKNDDGEEIDVYVLGINKPLKKFKGRAMAIINRLNNNNKLILIPKNYNPTDEEIEKSIEFQEKYFKHKIIR